LQSLSSSNGLSSLSKNNNSSSSSSVMWGLRSFSSSSSAAAAAAASAASSAQQHLMLEELRKALEADESQVGLYQAEPQPAFICRHGPDSDQEGSSTCTYYLLNKYPPGR
jgi:hypothetical protein